MPLPSIRDVPVPPRIFPPSERVLAMLSDAASHGLRDAMIPLACGMTIEEFQALRARHPEAIDQAIMEGRATGEYRAARAVSLAAGAGDVQAAKLLLTHRFGWKDAVQEDYTEVVRDSVQSDRQIKEALRARLTLKDIEALEEMRSRVIDVEVVSVESD